MKWLARLGLAALVVVGATAAEPAKQKQREALNAEWVRMFPDPNSRPARHTQALPADSRGLVQADFVAVLP